MCAFLTPPLLPRVLPKALLGITCSCIIITRAKRRGNKTAAHSTPSSCIEDGCKRDVWAEGPRGIVGAMKAKAATAVEQVQPLASLVKLLTSVRAYRMLESSLKTCGWSLQWEPLWSELGQRVYQQCRCLTNPQCLWSVRACRRANRTPWWGCIWHATYTLWLSCTLVYPPRVHNRDIELRLLQV